MRHRPWIMLGLAVLLVALVAGCAKKQASDMGTATDSTAFATNPTEQAQGNLTPQGQVPPPEPTPPAPTPKATAKPAPKAHATETAKAPAAPAAAPGITVPEGTDMTITLSTNLSSETAKVGDSWTGTVKDNVVIDQKTVIPAGSTVTGVVTAVKGAEKGDRAMLDLGIGSMTVEGKSYATRATTEAIVAGSTRARNIGAVAGGAAAGALIGRAVGGSGKGALIGGLLGGAAAGGAVAKSKGYQVVLKEGTELTFKVAQPTVIHR